MTIDMNKPQLVEAKRELVIKMGEKDVPITQFLRDHKCRYVNHEIWTPNDPECLAALEISYEGDAHPDQIAQLIAEMVPSNVQIRCKKVA